MTLGKNWYKSDRARLLFAILLNVAFLAVLLLCFEVRFEENDDLTVQKYLDGQTAVKTTFVVYINYFLARLLILLYNISGNALPIFSLLQYAMLLLSFTGLSYMLFRRMELLPAAAASLGILCFFGADSYLALTYTKTAGIATAGGVSLMLAGAMEKGGAKKWLPLGLGAVLLLFALMMRDKEFAACAALMAPLGLWVLGERMSSAPSGRRLREGGRFLLPFVLTIVLAAVLFLSNELIWNNSEYSDYKQFNAQRSRFVDYNVPEYEEMPEAYESCGIDKYTRDMFMENCYERSVWTGETYEKLSDARDSLVSKPSPGECLGMFLDHCLSAFFIQKPIYGLLAALVLWLAWGRRRLRDFAGLGLAFALFGLLYLYLIHQGRYLVNRTDAGFFFALAVTLLWLIDPQKARGDKVLCLVLILTCLGLGYRQNQNYCYFYSGNYLGDDSAEKAAVEALIDDEHFFIAEVDALNLSLYSPLETVPAGYADSIVLIGDWCENHPMNNAAMAAYGIEEPMRDLVDNDKACIISRDISTLLQFIRDNFAPQAKAELLEPLSSETGLNIYKITS